MRRPETVLPAVVLPLLALSAIVPGGLDTGVPAALAGALPLAWAAFASILAGGRQRVAAMASAIPFAAWAIVAYGGSADPSTFISIALDVAASIAVWVAGTMWIDPVRKRLASSPAPGSMRLIARYSAGAAPAFALHILAGPAFALPAAAFAASVAAFLRERSR